jgi:hypothetical protein
MVELAVSHFPENPVGSHVPQDTIERAFVGSGGFGQVLHGLGSACLDMIGNSEFRDAIDGLTQRCTRDELAQAFGFC